MQFHGPQVDRLRLPTDNNVFTHRCSELLLDRSILAILISGIATRRKAVQGKLLKIHEFHVSVRLGKGGSTVILQGLA
jgi:hypothetical protein